jgi:FHS family L-fucose permease-like MFS transporter
MKLRAVTVFLAFLAMGIVDAVGPFVSLAKKEFALSTAVASLIPFVGLSMFGLLSIPAGILQNRRGKKFVLLLGLTITLVGMLNASFGLTSFPRFLLTIVLIGAGAAVLQVAGNPLMRDISAKGKFPRNLSLGQFVKAIGSLSGPLIPAIAARFFGASWQVIFPVYGAALVLTILAGSTLKIPHDEPDPGAATLASCLKLLKNPYVLAMAAAIFVYVGAEICVSASIPLFLKERYGVDIARVGLLGTGLFFMALTVGRLLGGVILNWIAPARFLKLSCATALCGLLALFVPSRSIAVAGFVVIGLGFANIFPLVFSAALERMPVRTNDLSALMVTAIVGGAILPPMMGLLADHTTVRTGLLIPIAGIAYVSAVALFTTRGEQTTEAANALT